MLRARLQLLAAAALFSTGGAAIKACALSGFAVASLRSAVAAMVLLALLPRARRGWTRRTWLVGATYAATLVLFVLANKKTTSASTIFLQSTAPLYILLLGPWLLREPIRRRDLGFMAVLAVGLALFFVDVDPASGTAPDPLTGNVLAVLSGVCWALTMIGLRSLGRTTETDTKGDADGAARAVIVGNLVAFAVALPWALPLPSVGPADWALLAYLGVFQIAFAYLFVTRAIRHVSALEASLLLLVEPVLNPLWAWWIHGERPGAWALVGGGIILAATVWKARRP
jgi:DME family drug/metabolite transporter